MDPIRTDATITVFLADDNIIVREGVRAMLSRHPDIEIVGVADDYDSLTEGAGRTAPNVVVSDIRMPPSFQSEGIDGCKEIRKRHPGTGIVILSQFDDPDYAIALLSEGAAGYAYLLKDHIAEGDQLIAAIRAVAAGGSVLDPSIVDAMVRPAMRKGDLDPDLGGADTQAGHVDAAHQRRTVQAVQFRGGPAKGEQDPVCARRVDEVRAGPRERHADLE